MARVKPLTKILKDMGEVPSDSLAAAKLCEDKERAVAAAAMHNNPNGFSQELHGFSNGVLAFNYAPIVVDYLPVPNPKQVSYALWEAPKFFGREIPYSSDVVSHIVKIFDFFGYTCVPEFLDPVIGTILRKELGEIFDNTRKNYKIYEKSGKLPDTEAEIYQVKKQVDLEIY